MATLPSKKGDVMALSDNKILNSEVQEAQVVGKPKVLTGTVRQNQGVFDAFATLIKDKFNALIDDLDEAGAGEPATETTGGLMSAEDKAKLDNEVATLDSEGRVKVEQMPLLTDLPYFEDYMEARGDEIKEWATDVAEEVHAAINGYWKSSVVTNEAIITAGGQVQCPIGNYTPNVADASLVYINGLKLDASEYQAVYDPTSRAVIITLTNGLSSTGNSVWAEIFRIGGGDILAEAWAVGTKNNVPVAETDPTYHNNAKYYAEMNIAQYGIVEFTVENGKLVMKKTQATPFDFEIDSQGRLVVMQEVN